MKSLFVCTLLFITGTLHANTLYWIGGSGDWDNSSHWSYTSGGETDNMIPSLNDDVIFDENSFNSNQASINFHNVAIKSFHYLADNLTIFSGEQITISNNLNIEANFNLNTNIILSSNDNQPHYINTGGFSLNSNFIFEKGNWNLQNHLITSENNNIILNCKYFTSNGFSIYTDNLISKNTGTDLSNSSIFTFSSLNLKNAKKIGANPIFFTNGTSIVNGGHYSNAVTKDQTVNDCPGSLILDITISIDYNGSDVSCNGVCDGEITVIASGSPGPFSYRKNPSDSFGSVFVFSGLCPGSYTIEVVDSSQVLAPGIFAKCTADAETISDADQITFNPINGAIPIPPSCNGLCDGQAFTSSGGGTGTLVTSWPASLEVTSNPVGLCAGLNNVTIMDDNGCMFNDQLFLSDTPPITYDITITPPICNGESSAEILVSNEQGGNNNNGDPWTYNFSPIPSSGDPTANPAISYGAGFVTITVFDISGCQKDSTVEIIDPPVLTITAINPSDVNCFGDCDGSLTALPVGGVPPYSFEWFDNNTGITTGITDSIATTFCPGDYFVEVTDAFGCIVSSPPVNISTPTQLTAVAQEYPVSCFGVCDGSVDVDPSGGTLGYTFAWTSFPGGANIGALDSLDGLCPGQYQIIVTDANLCESTPIIVEVINAIDITLDMTGTNPSCYDICDGDITVNANGGAGGYLYNWVPNPPSGQGTPTISNLCGSIQYTVTVTDANGCTKTNDFTLTAPVPYDITVSQDDLLCFGDLNGSITTQVNSGADGGPYTFIWGPGNPTGQGTNTISDLTAGNYSVTISDILGCDTTLTFTIISPPQLTANAQTLSNVNCFGDCDGSAQVIVNGGTPVVTILWDDPLAQTNNVANGLCEGNYIVTLTDQNLCTATDNVTITAPLEFDITTSQTDLNCFGDCLATATVTVNSGGQPNYTITWDDPANQTGATAFGLCAGTYNATVTDQAGCDSILTFVILDPIELTINVTVDANACFGTCLGTASLTTVGGTGGLNYDWFISATNTSLGINNTSSGPLCPGDYYATVTDANGCTTQSPVFTITELPPILTNIVSTTDASCGVCNGAAEVSASGGAGGFSFNWTPVPGAGQGTIIGSALCGGVYSVEVTDIAGCTESQAVIINSLALEVLTLDSVDVTCFGDCDGQTNVAFACLEPPCVVEWFNNNTGITTGQFGNNASLLCADDYLAVLTNNLGCVTTDSITVNEPDQVIANITTLLDESCFNACDGSAIVTASGGDGNLTYLWSPLPGSGQGTTNAGGLCVGNWDVTVTDGQNCSTNVPFVINGPIAISVDNLQSTDITCPGANDGSLSIVVSGGTGVLNVEWFICNTNISVGNGNSLQPLAPGSYFAVITDDNNCTLSSNCITINDILPLSGNLNIQNSTCFGFCDGMIDVVASGGNGTYNYQWLDNLQNPIIGQTNDTINNLCQGIFYVEITDGANCSIIEGPIDMTFPISPWDVTATSTDINCFGDCSGTATVTVNAGNFPPYTYLWDDPLTQSTPTAIGLCSGLYNVTISDAGVCDTTIQFNIIEAPAFNNAGIQTDILCNGDCTGTAQVTPSGGVGPYNVTWSNGDIGNLANNLCVGPVTATIIDFTGCQLDTTFNLVEPLNPLIANSVFNNNASCGNCNGSATVNISGGTPIYTYNWTGNPTGDGTNNVSNLCSGIISVDITDFNGCTITEVFPIADVNAEVIAVNSTDETCFGSCDGTASVVYVCNDPGCTEEWFNATTGITTGNTSNAINALCADNYFVQVTNSSGCISIENFTITSPTQIIANEVITEITCAGDSDASITLTPTGGSGAGYTYVWNPIPGNGNGNNVASGIGPGLWSVVVTDGTNCSISQDFIILDTIPIVITPTVNDLNCNSSCDGSISTVVTGGYGSYQYQWFMNGALMPGETNPNLLNLCAGNYNVVVTDLNGCIQTLPNDITVSEPFPISAPITSTNILCFGDCNGTATITPSGGIGSYIINWYDGVTNILIGQTGVTASNLCPGDYYAIVTDVNNCTTTSAIITITEPSILTFVITENQASCFGVCDGDATLTLNGGTINYSYVWLNVLGNPIPNGNLATASNLCAGNYTVEGIDQNGCTTGQQNIVINGFSQITANTFSNDPDCGFTNGSASVFANGGNPIYTYQWLDNTQTPILGETNSTILNIGSGTYYVIVMDANLCTETFQVNVSDLPTTTIVWDLVQHPTCFEGNNGALNVTVSGISLPLTYVWNPGGMITDDITNLTAGNYILEVTDALGCINYYDTTLVDPDEIIISNTVIDSDCELCNGEIDITLSGGTGVLTPLWNNGGVGTNESNLCPGIYEIIVTDAANCVQTEHVVVNNTNGPNASVLINAITCPNTCDGVITISGVGGTLPYTFNWLNYNGSTNSSESNLCPDTYFIELIDNEGCISPIIAELLEPIPPMVVTETITPPTCGNNDGQISITSVGGNLPHTYLWNTGDITPAISNLTAGIYTLTVTDNSGCSLDFVYTVNNSDGPLVNLQATPINCNSICDGSISSVISGGTPNYNIQWLNEFGITIIGEINPTISNLCTGDYIIEVTDNAGCVIYESIEITEPDTLVSNSPFIIDPTCFGDCNGQIISNVFGGTLPYTYAWDDPASQTTLNPNGLCDGTYNLTLTDANNCIIDLNATLIEPTQITIDLDNIIDATCVNSNDGSIFVTIGGGTSQLNVEWYMIGGLDTTYNINLENALPGSYIITVTDFNNCVESDTFDIDTTITVIAYAGNDTIVCFNNGVVLNATSNQANADFTWYDISGNEISDTSELILNAQTPGEIQYIVMASYLGCDYLDTITVTTIDEVLADAGPDISMLSFETQEIGGDPTNNINSTTVWTPSTFLNDTIATNPLVINPQADTWYMVTVTDENGCINTDSIYVEVIPSLVIPDGISPNGDGKNDSWLLVFKDDFPDMEVWVYNRWGEMLFYDNTGYAKNWDGKFKGEELPIGSYYYVIDVHHELYPEPFTGPITIMR